MNITPVNYKVNYNSNQKTIFNNQNKAVRSFNSRVIADNVSFGSATRIKEIAQMYSEILGTPVKKIDDANLYKTVERLSLDERNNCIEKINVLFNNCVKKLKTTTSLFDYIDSAYILKTLNGGNPDSLRIRHANKRMITNGETKKHLALCPVDSFGNLNSPKDRIEVDLNDGVFRCSKFNNTITQLLQEERSKGTSFEVGSDRYKYLVNLVKRNNGEVAFLRIKKANKGGFVQSPEIILPPLH